MAELWTLGITSRLKKQHTTKTMPEIKRTDSERMQRLAKEGKQISKIWKEDFPDLTYADIYVEVYGAGERSSRGIKRMISSRLNSLVDANKSDRKATVSDLHELIWHLYENHKSNQRKIDSIRRILHE